jgi:Chalcone isomerase-like
MVSPRLAAVVVMALASGTAARAELVGVPGSSTKYPSKVEAKVGDKSFELALTGTAMRTKYILNVYAIGSYVQAGASVKTPEQLAAIDCVKRLHLVMERSVPGKDMAEAFRVAIRANYPAPAFDDEVTMLMQFMKSSTVSKDDHIILTHLPGTGLHCSMPGKADFTIKNPKFSEAVWNIYLGKNNVGDAVKKGLLSR